MSNTSYGYSTKHLNTITG